MLCNSAGVSPPHVCIFQPNRPRTAAPTIKIPNDLDTKAIVGNIVVSLTQRLINSLVANDNKIATATFPAAFKYDLFTSDISI